MKENQNIEWKESWKDEYLKWICGFANAEGGTAVIANAFFRAGEIEAWGRGMQQIMDACETAGTPKPKITYDPSDLWFEFPFSPEYVRSLAGSAEPAGISEKTPRESTAETVVKTVVKTRDRILLMIIQSPAITREALSKETGLSIRGVEWNLSLLKKEGKIRRIGPDKGGHWEVLK